MISWIILLLICTVFAAISEKDKQMSVLQKRNKLEMLVEAANVVERMSAIPARPQHISNQETSNRGHLSFDFKSQGIPSQEPQNEGAVDLQDTISQYGIQHHFTGILPDLPFDHDRYGNDYLPQTIDPYITSIRAFDGHSDKIDILIKLAEAALYSDKIDILIKYIKTYRKSVVEFLQKNASNKLKKEFLSALFTRTRYGDQERLLVTDLVKNHVTSLHFVQYLLEEMLMDRINPLNYYRYLKIRSFKIFFKMIFLISGVIFLLFSTFNLCECTSGGQITTQRMSRLQMLADVAHMIDRMDKASNIPHSIQISPIKINAPRTDSSKTDVPMPNDYVSQFSPRNPKVHKMVRNIKHNHPSQVHNPHVKGKSRNTHIKYQEVHPDSTDGIYTDPFIPKEIYVIPGLDDLGFDDASNANDDFSLNIVKFLMMTDLGFFTPAVISEPAHDENVEEMDESNQENNEKELKKEIFKEISTFEEIPIEFQLLNTREIFDRFLCKDEESVNVQILDFRQYLENHLMSNLGNKNIEFHIIASIAMMANYQLSIGKKCVLFQDDRFSKFFSKSLAAFVDFKSLKIKSEILVFLGNCFSHMDLVNVKSEALRLVGIGTLCSVDDRTRELYFEEIPEFKSVWEKTIMNIKSIKKESTRERVEYERKFMFMVLKLTLEEMALAKDEITDELLLFVENVLDLMLKIITQIPSRRFFNLILKDSFFFLRARESMLVKRLEKIKKDQNLHIKLLQLLDLVEFYSYFQIDESSGLGYSKAEILRMHYDRIKQIQKFCFQNLKDQTIDFALSNVGAVDNPDTLVRILTEIPLSALVEMSFQLGVRATDLDGKDVEKSFLIQSLIYYLHKTEMDRIEWMRNDSLYPDERIIFDDTVSTLNSHPLGLASLSLRYLSVSDYLYRNYRLLKFEYAYRLREDILDSSQRLAPVGNRDAKNNISISFQGVARMAVPIERITIAEKGNPMLGHVAPSFVKAHVIFSLSNYQKQIADEWDMLGRDDILYLLSYNASDMSQGDDEDSLLQKVNHKFGLKHVRACRIIGWRGANGELLKDGIYNESRSQDRSTGSLSSTRTLLVDLDPNQYVLDQNRKKTKGSGDFYESFNVIMRRRANDNTWSYLLQPFRDVVGFENLIPDWLKAGFLGHEDPTNSSYRRFENLELTMNFRDTFVDISHIRDCFPNMVRLTVYNPQHVNFKEDKVEPPFVLQFPPKFWEIEHIPEISPAKSKKRKAASEAEKSKVSSIAVKGDVSKFCPEGPKANNPFRYSADQGITILLIVVEAIFSGMTPALTMIKSPPGTNGTRVASQIAANLYQNSQNHHLLVVSPSDVTLDGFLDALASFNIDERHILRLGHPTDNWNPRNQFWGRAGRVDSYLSKRISLLEKVSRLAKSLNIEQDYGATCELAGYFFDSNVNPLWKEFLNKVSSTQSAAIFKDAFPFMDFFSDRADNLFKDQMAFSDAMHIAEGCYDYIRAIFSDLRELRPFEILRAGEDRADYLVMKGVRIMALNTSFASLHREKLLKLGFRFESLLLLDSGQILDSEAFLTFLLQTLHEETGRSRLERLVMVGDDAGLTPRVSNSALARKCHLNQSLFTRLTRLGFPVIELGIQAEYRPTIANVFRPCYKGLVDSPILSENEVFKYANPGFCFETQFISVDEYMGHGETEPRKRFIQNLGEAEYAVALYMYMRLIGYPNDLISILTSTYGQKELIKDILRQRCGWNNFFGTPGVVATIDEYQDQKNSFVIVSLVRTKQLGNLSDGRRLLTAFSRATTGLYVLGRKTLFEQAAVFQGSFKSLWSYPSDQLWLNTEESFDNKSRMVDNHQLKFIAKSSKWKIATKNDQDKIKAVSSVKEIGAFVHVLSQERL